jgi:ribosome recycling factor
MADNPLVKDCVTKMQKNLDHTLHEFSGIHTGKASPALVEGIMVDAYGSAMRLKECAAIHTPDSRMIAVQPWDKSLLKAIEKAIQMANIGASPCATPAATASKPSRRPSRTARSPRTTTRS